MSGRLWSNWQMTWRLVQLTAAIGLIAGPASAQKPPLAAAPSSVSMLLQNADEPFVSEALAGKLARVIATDKYPKTVFVAGDKMEIANEGPAWLVSLHNKLDTHAGQMPFPVLRIRIRKSDGAVIDLPAK